MSSCTSLKAQMDTLLSDFFPVRLCDIFQVELQGAPSNLKIFMSIYDFKEKILPRWKVTGKGRAVASEQKIIIRKIHRTIQNLQHNTSNGKFNVEELHIH